MIIKIDQLWESKVSGDRIIVQSVKVIDGRTYIRYYSATHRDYYSSTSTAFVLMFDLIED